MICFLNSQNIYEICTQNIFSQNFYFWLQFSVDSLWFNLFEHIHPLLITNLLSCHYTTPGTTTYILLCSHFSAHSAHVMTFVTQLQFKKTIIFSYTSILISDNNKVSEWRGWTTTGRKRNVSREENKRQICQNLWHARFIFCPI